MDRAFLPRRVGIVGLGLIGGSLALALRQAGYAADIRAWDPDTESLLQGVKGGVIDAPSSSLEELVATVDVAILAAPPQACEALLLDMLRVPGRAGVITDTASVKGVLCNAVGTLNAEAASAYVPGHPIAGSERSGVGAARADLFRQHRVILTPLPSTDAAALDCVRTLWTSAGAEVSTMGVAEHDAVLAATSHLPHVLAYALVDALANVPESDDIFRFAAGGFRDFTRIASSDPVMWRDVALTNRQAILTALAAFSRHLDRLRQAIDVGDGEALEATFRSAKAARDAYERRSLVADSRAKIQGED